MSRTLAPSSSEQHDETAAECFPLLFIDGTFAEFASGDVRFLGNVARAYALGNYVASSNNHQVTKRLCRKRKPVVGEV